MAQPNSNPLTRLLPSLTDVAFLFPLVLIMTRMGGYKVLLSDGDTGWHVRTGEWILDRGRIPHTDIFSFTRPGEPWFAWEWLWDVAFGWMHRQLGMPAVVVTSVFLICLVSALLFRLIQRRCPNSLLAIAVTILAMAATAVHWLARPHLFTMLLAVVFYSLLERVREGQTRWLWFLPPLMAVWTNLHGGFLVGIVLVLTYGATELLNALFAATREDRVAAFHRSRPYCLAGAACAAATLLNPYTYHLHVHIYRFLRDPFMRDNIVEYMSSNLHLPGAVYFEIMLILAVATALWNLLRGRLGDTVLLLVWAHFALVASRNIPILAIVAAPQVAQALGELLALARESRLAGWVKAGLAELENTASQVSAIDRLPRLYLVSAAGWLLLAAASFLPRPPALFKAEYDPKSYPAGALESLRRSDFTGRVFTSDDWGDYLAYRLYPAGRVFVDGRFDFYGSDFCSKYLDTIRARYGWEENLNRYGVDTVLLDVNAPLTGVLKESSRWRPVYDDGFAIAFRRGAGSPAGRDTGIASARASSPGTETGEKNDRQISKPRT